MKKIYFLFVLFIVDVLGATGEMVITVKCPAEPKLREHILAKKRGENFTVQCSESSKITMISLK